jgi:hypothetical protein
MAIESHSSFIFITRILYTLLIRISMVNKVHKINHLKLNTGKKERGKWQPNKIRCLRCFFVTLSNVHCLQREFFKQFIQKKKKKRKRKKKELDVNSGSLAR